MITDLNLPWGSVQWVGQINSFTATPELYRFSTGATIKIELWRGLAFSLSGEAAYVRDLINLRGREIAEAERILQTAQADTDYTFEADASFVYTFGSVHNTIVNPRFARVDVQEEWRQPVVESAEERSRSHSAIRSTTPHRDHRTPPLSSVRSSATQTACD